MVAGATGIDLFLLVIDAAEGARPQTHEHLAILRLLGIERGVVAVTKADAVDEETLELALAEARELVPEAEVVAVSAKTGAGLDELRAALAARRGRAARADDGADAALRRPRVHAARDRHGRHRHALVGDDRLRATCCASSRAGRDVRVRSVQVHDRAGRAGRGGPARRRRAPGRRARASSRRGDALVAARRVPRHLPARRRARGARAVPAAVTRPSRHGDVPRAGRASRPLRAAAARRPRRRRAGRPRRPPRAGPTVGGGAVLDPRRRADSIRAPDGSSAAARGDGRAVARTRRRDVERAATGCSRRLARGAPCRARATARRRPTRATRASPARQRPGRAAIVPLLGLERRGSQLYLPGATARSAGATSCSPSSRRGSGSSR